MAYTLSQFCDDHHALLTSGRPLAEALPLIADKLSALLRKPEFVTETFNDATPVGRRTLHHDATTDVYVLAHVYDGPKKGSPHNHGASWAAYGTAQGVTALQPRPWPNPAVRPWRVAFDRAPRQGVGDPRDRHGCRRTSALPLQARARLYHREGVRWA
ncbi:MAG: hypothetical protein NTV56_14655 [Alphaproteobacteria bacterium]|nr:hypothetical protein [Alphaproteobacteria bacterium]